jgi:RHS repeat-associated protein
VRVLALLMVLAAWSTATLPPITASTVRSRAVKVCNWLGRGQEQVLTYPSPAVKQTSGAASAVHRDHLGSVRAITDTAGARVESAVYKPFGEQTEFVIPGLAAPESKGWIGERYDADAGLQYLNARYYDPVLGMFLQPDWFEVSEPGVRTKRFSYCFNDPIHKLDQLGSLIYDVPRDHFDAERDNTAETIADSLRVSVDNVLNSNRGLTATGAIGPDTVIDIERTDRIETAIAAAQRIGIRITLSPRI